MCLTGITINRYTMKKVFTHEGGAGICVDAYTTQSGVPPFPSQHGPELHLVRARHLVP